MMDEPVAGYCFGAGATTSGTGPFLARLGTRLCRAWDAGGVSSGLASA
jgi:hypothetical protein